MAELFGFFPALFLIYFIIVDLQCCVELQVFSTVIQLYTHP